MCKQTSAAGVLDLKKIEADLVKGVNDKTWAPLVSTGIKTCAPVASSKYFHFHYLSFKNLLLMKKLEPLTPSKLPSGYVAGKSVKSTTAYVFQTCLMVALYGVSKHFNFSFIKLLFYKNVNSSGKHRKRHFFKDES